MTFKGRVISTGTHLLPNLMSIDTYGLRCLHIGTYRFHNNNQIHYYEY